MTSPVMFCVGATKAGTSWLHRALSDHPQCHFRALKELHYFDALDRGEVDRQIAEVTVRRDGYVADLDGAGRLRLATRLRQIADCDAWLRVLCGPEDDRAYLSYLRDGAEGRLVGDITPAYSLLSEERLASMARIAPDVRFVYLMRDPVARLWSHVRMIAHRRHRADGGEGDIAARAKNVLARVLAGKETEIEVRSDYRGALTRLGRAIDPRRLMVTLYEDLFTSAGWARICAFLGLSPSAPDFGRRVHAGREASLGARDARAARDWLAGQYDFVADWMGARPAGWLYEPQRV